MERSTRLASAPVTWGVWERTIDGDGLIPAAVLLETVAGLGYHGIELGPPGYLGDVTSTDGLALVGGFVPLHLADEAAFRADIPVWLDPIADVLAATGARGPVVLADAGTDERLAGAGRPDEQRRTALAGDALARALERVNEAADRCRARGVDAVFHHHVGTYVETPEEIAALLEGTDVGVCFDTGHAAVGGGDPLEIAQLCGPRIRHVHLKDVDASLLERVRRGELAVAQAWGEGLFCPFGDGLVDFGAVLALSELRDFDGWIVLEQDRVAVGVDDLPAVRAVEESNLRFVREALEE